jgi:hypothetical protein
MCGNSSSAASCPVNATCLPDVAPNPNFGYNSFDNFYLALISVYQVFFLLLSSFVTIIQVVVIDNWDGPYGYSLAATGSLSSIYYGVLVIFGSFFVSKLVLAVIASKFAEVSKTLEAERHEAHRQAVAARVPKRRSFIVSPNAIAPAELHTTVDIPLSSLDAAASHVCSVDEVTWRHSRL